MKSLNFILVGSLGLFLASCQSTAKGISNGSVDPSSVPSPVVEIGAPESLEDIDDAEALRRCATADFNALTQFYGSEAPALLPWLSEWKAQLAAAGAKPDESAMLNLRAGLQLQAAKDRFAELEKEVPGSGKAFLVDCTDELDAFFTGRKIEELRDGKGDTDALMSRLEQLCRHICRREVEVLKTQQAELETELAKPLETAPADRAAFQRQLAETRRLIRRKQELEDIRVKLRILEFSGEGDAVN